MMAIHVSPIPFVVQFRKKQTNLPTRFATFAICNNSDAGSTIKMLIQRILSCAKRQILHKQCAGRWVLFPLGRTLSTSATTAPASTSVTTAIAPATWLAVCNVYSQFSAIEFSARQFKGFLVFLL